MVFNVGNYRRQDSPQPGADFFDNSNEKGERMRRAAAEAAVTDMLKWFKDGGVVGILDATNSTKERRRWVKARCDAQGIETLFVESKCDDEALVMSNILEVKTTSPDYKGQDPETAAKDFKERIRNYAKAYQTIDEDENHLTYLKIMDVGKQVIINRIQDYLQSRVVYYLMNLHIKPRSIWLSRVCFLFLVCLEKEGPLLTCSSSMASPSSISRARSVAMLCSPHEGRCMLRSSPSWFANPSVYVNPNCLDGGPYLPI